MSKYFLFLLFIVFSCSLFAQTITTNDYNGYKREHFKIDQKNAWVTIPTHAAPGNPWIWRARFPGFHDEIDKEMLGRGFHVAHVNTENMYGSPNAISIWDNFYKFVVAHYKLNPKVSLVGVSRGGLFIYQFAKAFPLRVASIYGDTPVMDFTTWPLGLDGTGTASVGDWNNLKKEYGFKSDKEAIEAQNKPINYADNLAQKSIPIFHVVGPEDKIVPPEFNTLKFRKNYPYYMVVHNNGGPYSLQGHHFPLDNVRGSCDFIERFATLPPLKKEVTFFDKTLNIGNTFAKIKEEKEKVRVVYLGGSITQNAGWQNMVTDYLKNRFPNTQFECVNIGIGSHCSPIHAFRWREHFAGPADLVFFESAVNDLHNSRTPNEQKRAYEGVIRGIKMENPKADIVCLQFAEPRFTASYQQGKIPEIIARHESIANYYAIPSINLAKEVAMRMSENQFSWNKDFRDLHPSPFGQRLYFQTIKNFLDQQPLNKKRVARKLPKPMIKNPWEKGHFQKLETATDLKGFSIVPKWSAPPHTGEQRAGYYNVPMLVGSGENSEFTVNFNGTAFGLMLVAGFNSAPIEWQVDNTPPKQVDTFGPWSKNLHIPFAYILEPNLPAGEHRITIKIKPNNKRDALHVRYLLVN